MTQKLELAESVRYVRWVRWLQYLGNHCYMKFNAMNCQIGPDRSDSMEVTLLNVHLEDLLQKCHIC